MPELEKLTLDELKVYATERGIPFHHNNNTETLIKIIRNHKTVGEDNPEKKTDSPPFELPVEGEGEKRITVTLLKPHPRIHGGLTIDGSLKLTEAQEADNYIMARLRSAEARGFIKLS